MRAPDITRSRAYDPRLLVLLPALALALAGCSRHTALTVRADLVPFMSVGETQLNRAPIAPGTSYLDWPFSGSHLTNPGHSVDLTSLGAPSWALTDITAFALTFAAQVTPSVPLAAGTATLYLAPSSASDVHAYPAVTVDTPPVAAGQTATVSITADDATDASALPYLRSGSFLVGAEVEVNASGSGTARVTLTHLLVTVSLPPGWGLP